MSLSSISVAIQGVGPFGPEHMALQGFVNFAAVSVSGGSSCAVASPTETIAVASSPFSCASADVTTLATVSLSSTLAKKT